MSQDVHNIIAPLHIPGLNAGEALEDIRYLFIDAQDWQRYHLDFDY